MSGWSFDLRHALSVYRGTPIATAIAVIALATAMAFATAFLSMWNDLSLRPPEGFHDNGRLVTMGLAVPNLFVLPFGTALGIYALWVLLHNESRACFEPS